MTREMNRADAREEEWRSEDREENLELQLTNGSTIIVTIQSLTNQINKETKTANGKDIEYKKG